MDKKQGKKLSHEKCNVQISNTQRFFPLCTEIKQELHSNIEQSKMSNALPAEQNEKKKPYN